MKTQLQLQTEQDHRNAQSVMECGGKRGATPLWLGAKRLGDEPFPSGSSRCPRSQSAVAALALPAHSKTWRTIVTFCFLLSAVCFQASGQYAIDWHTIDGGGGTSTGGTYRVTGTIGQPDAGAMSGGNYTLQGGFWGVIAAVQTPGAPLLTIFHTTTNTVAVIWPSPSAGWNLQQNTNSVNSVNWSNVTAGIQDSGTAKVLVVNPPTSNRFYRLHKP